MNDPQPHFQIKGAFWNPTVNQLLMRCSCGFGFTHPANRVNVSCPKCKKQENLHEIRDHALVEALSAKASGEGSEEESLPSETRRADTPRGETALPGGEPPEEAR